MLDKLTVHLHVFRLLKSSNWEIRERAAKELGRFNQRKAIDALIRALEEDESIIVRTTVAESLGQLRSPVAIPPLINLLDNHDEQYDAFIRGVILLALGRIRNPSVLNILIPALKDGRTLVRDNAKEALVELGEVSVIPLMNILHQENDFYNVGLRRAAAEALAKIGDKRAVDALLDCLANPSVSWWDKRACIYALGELKDRRAIVSLSKCLASEEVELRFLAIRALKKLGDPSIVPSLMTMLQDSEQAIVNEARDAIEVLTTNKSALPNTGST